MNKSGITLSIETAIQGGSLSILIGDKEIDFWVGSRDVSRSEDILEQISILLRRNKIEKKHIDLIVTSHSIGSHTGLRIGLATVLGLSKALDNCKIVEISILTAITGSVKADGRIIAAISNNNRDIIFQIFEKLSNTIQEISQVSSMNYHSFCKMVEIEPTVCIITNERLYKNISESEKNTLYDVNLIKNAGENLAKQLGLKGQEVAASDNKLSSKPIKSNKNQRNTL
jgi:tRNA A37 threonylcarbamoyladenosine modification protein TsaB